MLILTRRPSECIMIGGDIAVRVLSITGVQVKIGIDAPRELPVDREEIFLKKRADQRRGASSGNARSPSMGSEEALELQED